MGPGYRGVDRRGIINDLAEPGAPRLAVGVLVWVVAVPLVGVVAVRMLPLGRSAAALSVGAGDTALVCLVAAGLLLLLRWRLVGEASSVLQGVGGMVAGLLLVPAVPAGAPLPTYLAGLQIMAIVVVLALFASSLRLPEVCGGLRPAVIAAWAFGLALVVAVPLAVPLVGAREPGFPMAVVRAAEAVACLGVAVPLLIRGVRRDHPLFVGIGGVVAAMASACAMVSAGLWTGVGVPPGPPTLFLAAGAIQLLLLVVADLHSALTAVVRRDVRGRRRWTAAESEAGRLRQLARGRQHDVSSMLAAVDGTLMVLIQHPEGITQEGSNRLIGSVRGQIQQLMAMLALEAKPARRYDVSALLRDAAAIHGAALSRLQASVPPGLLLEGREDRVAIAVNNLLANASVHAPDAGVTLSARLQPGESEEGSVVEIRVSDRGPGLPDTDLDMAVEPGWRGVGAGGTLGSGLGLFQCRQLVEAEGGTLTLTPTRPLAPAGSRGLTVVLRLPAPCPLPRSSILRMRPAPTAAIPEIEASGDSRLRGCARAGLGAGADSAEDRPDH